MRRQKVCENITGNTACVLIVSPPYNRCEECRSVKKRNPYATRVKEERSSVRPETAREQEQSTSRPPTPPSRPESPPTNDYSDDEYKPDKKDFVAALEYVFIKMKDRMEDEIKNVISEVGYHKDYR